MTPPRAASGLVDAPATLAAEMAPWVRALPERCGPAFRALYLYGSALTTQFDPQGSDVNLLLVVTELSFDRLEALALCVRELAANMPRGRRVSPLVLTESQIAKSVDVFPAEFLDLAARRALLAGADVLARLTVGRANLRQQCEYELRSKLVGLRQAFLLSGGEPGTAQRLLARSAGGLAAVLRQLLALGGEPAPDAAEPLVAAVARAYGVDAAALSAPFAARRAPATDDALSRTAFATHLAALEALIDAVDAQPAS